MFAYELLERAYDAASETPDPAILRKAGWYEKTSQAFAVFLPVKSVGVTGDGRRHEPVIALRAVETAYFRVCRSWRGSRW